jgi:serine/threonine-protein kinase
MTGDPPTTPISELGIGEVLNATWKLEELIGVGGMGRVFRAEDLKLGRKAAVKAVSIKNLDDDTLQRFERESRVMGKLNHPGIVTLYGVGRTRGIPWLAMRYLEGANLTEVMKKQGPHLPPAQVLEIARQLCDALGYIHQRSLLHRDLKPSNIHVAADGRATLLDLGLARGRKSNLTRTGVVWGTPEYMAPEQITGERELDGRSDLYALAIVLYRMLSGELPFDRGSDADVMQAHLAAERPDISRVRPDVSLSLGAALQKAMAVHPDDRFQTAAEMLAALEHAMAERPREGPTMVAARPSSPRLPRPSAPAGTSPVHLGTPTSPLDLDVTPKGRRITGEVRVAPAPPALSLSNGPPPQATPLSLEDDDDSPEVRTQKEGFAPLDSNSTKREGFVPLAAAEPTGPQAAAPITEPTPVSPVPAPAQPPAKLELPMYLTPPFLIGALVVVLLIGILLGKML